jgi:signal transduction histidine kinase
VWLPIGISVISLYANPMETIVIFVCALLALMVTLQVRVYQKLKSQTKLLVVQNQEQERQKKLLQGLITEKEQLISLVSHDLKGPFNRIYAIVQLLSMSSPNLTNEQQDYIGKIHQISSDGLAMLRNLLDNRRLEDKGIDLFIEKVNLTLLVSNLVKNYTTLAEKKRIQVHFEKQSGLVINSDKITLNRIVENLLSNALKFTPPEKNIFVNLVQNGENFELTVIDEGPGISLEDQQKLFVKYQRLSARPTGGESSTGLGLYLVKNMAEKINGHVSYEGNLGRGSQFKISLKNISQLTE